MESIIDSSCVKAMDRCIFFSALVDFPLFPMCDISYIGAFVRFHVFNQSHFFSTDVQVAFILYPYIFDFFVHFSISKCKLYWMAFIQYWTHTHSQYKIYSIHSWSIEKYFIIVSSTLSSNTAMHWVSKFSRLLSFLLLTLYLYIMVKC